MLSRKCRKFWFEKRKTRKHDNNCINGWETAKENATIPKDFSCLTITQYDRRRRMWKFSSKQGRCIPLDEWHSALIFHKCGWNKVHQNRTKHNKTKTNHTQTRNTSQHAPVNSIYDSIMDWSVVLWRVFSSWIISIVKWKSCQTQGNNSRKSIDF